MPRKAGSSCSRGTSTGRRGRVGNCEEGWPSPSPWLAALGSGAAGRGAGPRGGRRAGRKPVPRPANRRVRGAGQRQAGNPLPLPCVGVRKGCREPVCWRTSRRSSGGTSSRCRCRPRRRQPRRKLRGRRESETLHRLPGWCGQLATVAGRSPATRDRHTAGTENAKAGGCS